jgi:hypothetical protein
MASHAGAAMKEAITGRFESARKKDFINIVDVEYRLKWDEGRLGWDVLRNGAMTDVSGRRKRKSAVDSAIRLAKAELEASKAVIMVTSLEGRKLQILWKAP